MIRCPTCEDGLYDITRYTFYGNINPNRLCYKCHTKEIIKEYGFESPPDPIYSRFEILDLSPCDNSPYYKKVK